MGRRCEMPSSTLTLLTILCASVFGSDLTPRSIVRSNMHVDGLARYGIYYPHRPRRSPRATASRTALPSTLPIPSATPSPSSFPVVSVSPSATATASKPPLASVSSSPAVVTTPVPPVPPGVAVYRPDLPPVYNLELFRLDLQRRVADAFNRPGDRIVTDAALVNTSAPGFPFRYYPKYVWRPKYPKYGAHVHGVDSDSAADSATEMRSLLSVASKQVIKQCGQSNCAARVNITSRRFIRREIVRKAVKLIQKGIQFTSVFNPRSQRFRIIRRSHRLFTVIMPFNERYLAENPFG